MPDVSREVKIVLTVEGDAAAKEKIENLINGVGRSVGGGGTSRSRGISEEAQAKKDEIKRKQELRDKFSAEIANERILEKKRQDEKILQLNAEIANRKHLDREEKAAEMAAKKKESADKKQEELQKKMEPVSTNMRQQLTGMLIWMHTFRVFGEYSSVLKSQFTMLGNAIGMIMNQVLIPLYPLLATIIKYLYIFAALIGKFMKWLGNLPSLILSIIIVGGVLGKLFGFLSWTMFGHRKAVDADTAALLRHTGALDGKTLFGKGKLPNSASGGTLGATLMRVLPKIGVALTALLGMEFLLRGRIGGSPMDASNDKMIQIGKELKLANKFQKEQTKPWQDIVLNYIRSFLNILLQPFLKAMELAKTAQDLAKNIDNMLKQGTRGIYDAVDNYMNPHRHGPDFYGQAPWNQSLSPTTAKNALKGATGLVDVTDPSRAPTIMINNHFNGYNQQELTKALKDSINGASGGGVIYQ